MATQTVHYNRIGWGGYLSGCLSTHHATAHHPAMHQRHAKHGDERPRADHGQYDNYNVCALIHDCLQSFF